MEIDKPKVSIVIPVYNSASTIRRALQSVADQTFRDFETIIVDNNCTDASITIARTFQDDINLRIVDCEEQGIVPALNAGLSAARGELIARQDADDYWYPTKLEKQVKFLENNPNVDILGTQIRLLDENGVYQPRGTYDNPVIYPTDDSTIKTFLMLGQNPLCHPSVMFRKSVFLIVGGYTRLFHLAEDLHYWCRALPHCNFANIDEQLIDYTQTIRKDYNPNTPLFCADHYYDLYKKLGIVAGDRPELLYKWQVEGDNR